MKILRCFLIILFVVVAFNTCKEEQKFGLSSDDKTIPGVPVVNKVIPTYGGAVIYYTPPSDKDLLQVVAEFDGPTGEVFKFSASYFKDSINVYGLGEDREYTLRLYSLDRADNKSAIVPVMVTPLESSILRVAKTLNVKAGFESFYIDWVNELEQTINIVVDFEFTMAGASRNIVQVLSSNKKEDRQFISDLKLGPNDPINMKITVEDIYKNVTEPVVFNGIVLLQDNKIPKDDWQLPIPIDTVSGIPQCFGNFADGRMYRVIDDLIDYRNNNNYLNCNERGRVGSSGTDAKGFQAGNWNLIVDLGAYYYLSRIVTHQRHSGGTSGQDRGQYYNVSTSDPRGENVGYYAMWYLDEDEIGYELKPDGTFLLDNDGNKIELAGNWVMNGTEYVKGCWKKVSEHKIPIPITATNVEIIAMGQKGDEAYLYPDDPGFTPKSARWFRYEALGAFQDNYTNRTNNNCLSEITLYGTYDRPK